MKFWSFDREAQVLKSLKIRKWVGVLVEFLLFIKNKKNGS